MSLFKVWRATRPTSSGWARLLAWSVAGGALLAVRARHQQERHDRLTRLLSREGFEQSLGRSRRSGTLALVAVNRLKLLNVQQGWKAGDRLLREVARALSTALPPGSLLARWSGDEFLAFVPESEFQVVDQALSRLQGRLPSAFAGQPTFVFGLAPLHSPEGFRHALNEVDHEVYLDKGTGEVSAQTLGEERGLFEFALRLAQLEDPEVIIRRGLPMARKLLHFEAAAYYRVEGHDITAYSLDYDPAVPLPQEGIKLPIHISGLAERALREHCTVISVDAPNDPEATGIWTLMKVQSAMVAPVEISGQPLGLLGMGQLTGHKALPVRAQHVLELAALRLAHALELREKTQALRRTLEGGLLGLGVALEVRDLESYGHTQRVVDASVRLGRALGLDPLALDELRQGAYLHDIGKLSIPDRILLKPGPLDPDEWRIMQGHAAAGASIAAHIPQLSPGALDVIRSHHERWDGTGYPSRLAGEEIPLLARIFTVCDVYDALTSERPYKAAWTPEEARAEIAAQAGRQFDPRVVRAFLEANEPVPTAWDDQG
ncbi:HD domain-containing protein [Deinococcus metallilatus]|uniref:Diguanylate cyclase (GGDEF)-like protein n=1 Tax=Deinococcus metallilatus TaxID=1211322 RepID=A0AAJ5F3S4_9DEIO|nr:HD domain-containing phosphohydrolase [Deinococcus metallilatus]MBB5295349.1 diguanylate cyclase (GGDEF)-like protein [Deinococcus metallilatus]QBY08112.1 HD domain-containing protein [Deinococcus metallilatus]RXJ12447.1 HD domain-containing protein [Deinococcus metallilatus]TLK21070.1 HD domain-containing protein [Deinococcus metallilatus]